MGNWAYKINIKQFLTDEETKEAMQRAYDGIMKETARAILLPKPEKFEKYAKLAIEQNDIELFNNMALNALYDWADHWRVWLGTL